MEKKNSILEKLGIDENQGLDAVVSQLKSNLGEKTSPEKLDQIISAVTDYFATKEAVVVEAVAEEIIEEVIEEAVEEVAEEIIEEAVEEVAEEIIEEIIEEAVEEVAEEIIEEIVEEAIVDFEEEVLEEAVEEAVEEVAEEIIEEVIEEAVEEVAEEIIEEIVEEAIVDFEEEVLEEAIDEAIEEIIEEEAVATKTGESFNISKFYLAYNKNGFWSKVNVGLTAVLVLLSFMIASKFAIAIGADSINIGASNSEVAKAKPLLIILLLVVVAIIGIYYVEMKLFKDKANKLSRTLPVIASSIATIGFLFSVGPVFRISKALKANAPSTGGNFWEDLIGGVGNMFIEPLSFMQSVNFQVIFSFVVFIGVFAIAAIVLSIMKKREFTIGLIKTK